MAVGHHGRYFSNLTLYIHSTDSVVSKLGLILS
jgi:hypothetical protein